MEGAKGGSDVILADKHEPESIRRQCDGVYDLKRLRGNGDYLISVNGKELLVERKTASDFIHTIYQEGRLNEQLEGVDVLVFERYFVPKMPQTWWLKLYTYLNGVSAHTPVFYTLSPSHTLHQLRIVEKKLSDGTWGAMRKAVMLPPVTQQENESQVRVLLGLPGMGEKRANDVLKYYGSLSLALQNYRKWGEDVKGIGPITAKRIIEALEKKII